MKDICLCLGLILRYTADNINQAKTRNEHLEKIIDIQKKIAGDFIVHISLYTT